MNSTLETTVAAAVRNLTGAGGQSKPEEPPIILRPDWRRVYLGLIEEHPEVRAMGEAVESWTKRAMRNAPGPRLLVLAGPSGNGKSKCARGAINVLLRASCGVALRWRPNGYHTEFKRWADIVDTAETDRKAHVEDWRLFIQTEMIGVDDFGSHSNQFKSDLGVGLMLDLLDARENRWTVITMNFPPSKWGEIWDKRVESRLHLDSQIIELPTAPDWRKRNKP